jgi:hypothetical protein
MGLLDGGRPCCVRDLEAEGCLLWTEWGQEIGFGMFAGVVPEEGRDGAMSGLKKFEAGRLVRRCRELCERILRDQGDRADMEIVQLQHDCAVWEKNFKEGEERD